MFLLCTWCELPTKQELRPTHQSTLPLFGSGMSDFQFRRRMLLLRIAQKMNCFTFEDSHIPIHALYNTICFYLFNALIRNYVLQRWKVRLLKYEHLRYYLMLLSFVSIVSNSAFLCCLMSLTFEKLPNAGLMCFEA